MAELAPDTLVDGRYRIVTRLGSGGMADVYCAVDEQLGRQVALKLLHDRFVADQEFVERFRREASSAAGLSHPNVVSVYDRGEWEGTYYIAMEYLDGWPLKALVSHHGALDPVRAIDLVIQILRAARFAHQRGIIHRDLKPHNVIVDAEDQVKVTDFGIARAGASDMTETGSIMGTAQYLSPEQAQGHAVNASSDLYSVGIVLYELLTGQVPFDGPSAVTIALKQVSEQPSAPSLLNAAVTPELDAVVLRALAKDRAQRHADAEQFIAELEYARQAQLAVLGGSTAHFPAVTPVAEDYPAAPLLVARRRRWWPWLLGAVALLAAALVAVLLLSGGSKKVPDVSRQSEPAAASILGKAGFKVAIGPARTDPGIPVGFVVASSPRAGAEASSGSTVTLFLSSGPGVALVPDVVSLGRRAARQTLRQAGFQVAERLTASDSEPRGRVTATRPGPGTQAPIGSTVTVEVSSGRAHGVVPAVVGRTFAEAAAVLQGAGFAAARLDQLSTDQKPGIVLDQLPAANAQAARGATVTLTVAKAPDVVPVPDVTGQTRQEARSALTAAGFQVQFALPIEVNDPAQNGRVVRQVPSGGRPAKRGSTVKLTVGHYSSSGPSTIPAQ
ncbi:MAG TPA: PASTA domain-containing protein [Solirubrobacteraceae bacterium]|jgi:serine/threonine-protein kinase|nr:PASTA domain-containing protein [Solirubrobacteraceae bacterium]